MKRLREYQKEALEYCRRTRDPVLWMQMRLGKTVVVCRELLRDGAKRVLVVAPNSALYSWETELRSLGQDDIVYLIGTRRKREKILAEGHQWNLLNREGFRAIPRVGKERWDAVILDESASCIRSPRTKITRFFLSQFQEARRRFTLDGNPDPQNRLLDYWPQMAWANRGSWLGFSNFWHFRASLFREVSPYIWSPAKGTKKRIENDLAERCFILRRSEVGLDVAKEITVRKVEMPVTLRDRYTVAERQFILQGLNGTRFSKASIEVYTFLRRLASGTNEGGVFWNGKIAEVLELLQGELADERVVISANFRSDLDTLSEALTKGKIRHVVLHGAVKVKDRNERIEKFQRGRARVLLAQPMVIETGADLGSADTIVFYNLPLPALTWTQIQDRLLGDLTKKGIFIVILEADRTVDEDVRRLVTSKTKGSAKLLEDARLYQKLREFAHARLEGM